MKKCALVFAVLVAGLVSVVSCDGQPDPRQQLKLDMRIMERAAMAKPVLDCFSSPGFDPAPPNGPWQDGQDCFDVVSEWYEECLEACEYYANISDAMWTACDDLITEAYQGYPCDVYDDYDYSTEVVKEAP